MEANCDEISNNLWTETRIPKKFGKAIWLYLHEYDVYFKSTDLCQVKLKTSRGYARN